MAKTIVFKPEFEAKLKQLKIKTKFVNNFKQWVNEKGTAIDEELEILNNRDFWGGFVRSAFPFEDTPEHFDYWWNISKL